MSNGVRETICSRCLHRPVCSYKDNYLAALNRLEEFFYSIPEENRSVIVFQDPICKFNREVLNTPKYTNEGNRLLAPEELFGPSILSRFVEGA